MTNIGGRIIPQTLITGSQTEETSQLHSGVIDQVAIADPCCWQITEDQLLMDDENYTNIKDGGLFPIAPLPWFDYNCKRKVLEKL